MDCFPTSAAALLQLNASASSAGNGLRGVFPALVCNASMVPPVCCRISDTTYELEQFVAVVAGERSSVGCCVVLWAMWTCIC